MRNMYRVTRPAWAAMERLETAMILGAGFVIGAFGAEGEESFGYILGKLGVSYPNPVGRLSWVLIALVAPVLGCLLLIWAYKRQRVGCYPRTFVYCFNMPEDSNPNGKSQVVGYCHIDPDLESGEIVVEGASFFWENRQLDFPSRVGFTSTQVRGTMDKGETTCHIRFDINKEDAQKRLYHHGHLQFRLANGADRNRQCDGYAGLLQSTKTGIQEANVYARGYAEPLGQGNLGAHDIRAALDALGSVLFGKLDALSTSLPLPTLWTETDMTSEYVNVWGHKIPTPQSVILNPSLRPHIEKLLGRVLGLFGLSSEAIERFKRLAVQAAQVSPSVVAYERELKAGLIRQTIPHYESKALCERAKTIYSEIADHLVGDSLLDIGCGNGLVSNMAPRSRFIRIQLLDVVDYVVPGIDLPFRGYQEGHPLPVNELFDTVLFITVLHHSKNPSELLKLAWAATKKRLIIIESVVGIRPLEPHAKYELIDRKIEDQIAYAAFVDWFYNGVLHDGVPVPYNFTTPEQWRSVFAHYNMRIGTETHLGQDIEIGPEYHMLFVLDK